MRFALTTTGTPCRYATGLRHDIVVKIVNRVVDAASGTFGVPLDLPNRKQNLPAGVRCKVQFH